MTESEIKARLERVTHRPMTRAEWQHLRKTNLVSECATGELSWQEFRYLAAAELERVRDFHEDQLREDSGEIEAEDNLGHSALASADPLCSGTPETTASLSDRTRARASAMTALSRLRGGDRVTPRPIISSTRTARGGDDGTLPQWIIFLGVEAWVPAEEVKEAYRTHQQYLLAEPTPPKTQTRAFGVAKFVWDEDRVHGKRLPWPVLWKRWNDWFPTEPFKGWRDFRTYFLRGEKATLPRYVVSNEQITKQVESGAGEQAFDSWVSSFRE